MISKQESLVPYISIDYYADNFQLNHLQITKEQLKKSERPIYRNEIEFIYIYSGTGHILINGSVLAVSEDDLLLLMPYHVHGFQLLKNESLKVYRVVFSIGLLLLTNTNRKMYLEALKRAQKTLPIMKLNPRQKKQVHFICEETYLEKQEFNGSTEALNVTLISLLSYIFQKNQFIEHDLQKIKTVRWEILEFIQFHYQRPLTVENVASQVYLSVKEVQNELKKLTGVGFSEHLNRTRIRNAVALLQFEELSIHQISQICGYQTEANFYKVFKKIFNKTPAAYRAQGIQQPVVQIRVDAWEIYIYIQNNFQRALQLKTAAQELTLSEKKINHLLAEAFAKTFKEIVNESRLFLAKNLLITIALPIKEISQYVGFQDVATFSRNFKKYYGQTPKQFRLHHSSL